MNQNLIYAARQISPYIIRAHRDRYGRALTTWDYQKPVASKIVSFLDDIGFSQGEIIEMSTGPADMQIYSDTIENLCDSDFRGFIEPLIFRWSDTDVFGLSFYIRKVMYMARCVECSDFGDDFSRFNNMRYASLINVLRMAANPYLMSDALTALRDGLIVMLKNPDLTDRDTAVISNQIIGIAAFLKFSSQTRDVVISDSVS